MKGLWTTHAAQCKKYENPEPKPVCKPCDCARWDGKNYSKCVQRPRSQCRRYCVQCKNDGITPMKGLYTTHAAQCKKYENPEPQVCKPCDCAHWDGKNYSKCVQRPRSQCRRYCVQCKNDGITPMKGLYTTHAAQCKEYENGDAPIARDERMIEEEFADNFSDALAWAEEKLANSFSDSWEY